MNTSNQMQSVAAQAAIGQEPVVCTVTYAITGDPETDFIAGIMACLQSIKTGNTPHEAQWRAHMAQRVCEYLAGRFKDYARHHDEAVATANEIDRMRRMQPPDRTTNPVPTIHDWTTTGGTGINPLAQSGTQSSPSQCPDSVAGSGAGESFGDVLRSLPDIEPDKL